MGFFDNLRCDYPLPDPDAQHEIFQTKSLDRSLTSYIITEDGRLLQNTYSWQGSPDYKDAEFEEVSDFTGDVIFYTYLAKWNAPGWLDSWVEFRARFVNGRLQEITNVYEDLDHT